MKMQRRYWSYEGKTVSEGGGDMNVEKMLELFTLWQKDLHTESHIILQLSANTTVSISEAWTWAKIPFNTIYEKTGVFKNSTLSNNGISIPVKGIYRISGNIASQQPAYFGAAVNGTVVGSGIQSQTAWASVPIPTIIRTLNVGDIVTGMVEKSTATNPPIAGDASTRIVIEKIG